MRLLAVLCAAFLGLSTQVYAQGGGAALQYLPDGCGTGVASNAAALSVNLYEELCISGTINATTSAIASGTLPTLGAGANSIYESLSGAQYNMLVLGSALVSSSNPLPVTLPGTVPVSLNAVPSLANGNGTVPTQGGSVLSATNGLYVTPTTGAVWSVNIVSGATGGGAVYGPTAAGSAAANPPVLMGGTVDGTATGNVDNWKVASGIGYITGNLTQGGSALSATNGLFVTPTTGAVWAVNDATGNGYLSTIATNTAAAIPSGSNLIGKVGIDQTTDGTTNGVRLTSQYPAAATAVLGATSGTTAATTLTLSPVGATGLYLCWFSIRSNATAAANGVATITGTLASLYFNQWTAPVASGVGVAEEIFTPCIPASGVSQSISINAAAPGSGGVITVSGGGYYK